MYPPRQAQAQLGPPTLLQTLRCCAVAVGPGLAEPRPSNASAIDTDLPVPPEHTHMMLASKATWVEVQVKRQDRRFDDYPDKSLAQWHLRLGLEKPGIRSKAKPDRAHHSTSHKRNRSS